MNIKKETKAGNVILYLNTAGQPFTNANSTVLYNAGNGNTSTAYTAINVVYPTDFTEPIKISDASTPATILLSSGKDGGALSIDYISVYGYVYKVTDTPPAVGFEKSFTVNLNQKVTTINPLFWGTNFLFWIEDDAALQDKKIETSIKDMPCTILRYPGGTVADNFHWKTNMLENINRFPSEQGASESDFEEFIAFCRRVNAEPLLVVNTESWWINSDLDAGAKEAADWVQYCKDKNYNVTYWEIGNETYWHPFMTAREYGQLVKKYAQAMKGVDPTIKISANGHWDVDMVGTKERTTASQWEIIRLKYKNITTPQETQDADAYADLYKETNITSGTEKWWNNVAEECGAYIDMLTVHWYYAGSDNMSSMTANLQRVQQVFKTKFPNRTYTMCMTEYNCNNEDHKFAISGLFDGIGRFLNAGFEIGNFWPLRNTVNGSRTSILNPTTKEVCYPYQILKLLGNNLKGDLVNVNSENLIFPYVSYDGNQLTLVVSGRGITSQPVYATMNLPELNQFTLIDAKAYDAPVLNTNPIRLVESDLNVNSSETACTFKVMPYQTVMLRFKNKNTATPEVKTVEKIIFNYVQDHICFQTENKVNATLYNLSGQIISQKKGSGLIRLNVPAIGLYILKVDSDTYGSQVQKIWITP
ncbi:MAG: hypothetical protein NTY32_09760 [Bacteroidia bacterium]|nr:hypothetical protein [Bacteroidia bacterium]